MPVVTFFPVSAYVQEVQKVLQDEVGFVYDPVTEILPALNDACAATISADPQALVFNVPYQIVPFNLVVKNPGQGYAAGDTVILAGGVFTTPITLVVAGANGTTGTLDMADVTDYGSYTTYPAIATQASTSGAGTGATFGILKCGPRQKLTPDGASLIDIRMDLGADGQTMTNIVTEIAKDSMDADLPTWPMDVCGVNGKPSTVQHFMMDPDDPKCFYTWPTPNVMQTPWFLQIIYRSVPNDVALGDAFPIPSLYWPAVKAYIIAHVLQRNDKIQNDQGIQKLITDKMQEWREMVGATETATTSTLPRNIVNKSR